MNASDNDYWVIGIMETGESRKLAAKSRGPRHRYYKRPHVANCLSSSWKEYLARPGPNGGCQAFEIDFDK